MPLYQYACPTCGATREEYRSVESRHDAPFCCVRMVKEITPHLVNMDIEPYKAIAGDRETGKRPWIKSRKQHRDFLRKNGYEEVGTEPFEKITRKPKEKEDKVEIRLK